MAVFAYRAVGADAAAVNGMIVADSPRAARDTLRSRGLTVHEVTADQSTGTKSSRGRSRFRFRTSGTNARTVAFIRELSTLLGVGIPLLEAIDTIKRQHPHGRFGATLLALRDRISAGVSLADAMREQPDVFDELCVSITEVGESTGTLDVALERVAEFKERSLAFRNRLGTVLLYPSIVLVMAVGVSVLLMTVVVPNLLAAIVESGQELPLPTRIVKAASDFLVARWWVLAIAVVMLIAGVRALMAMPRVRFAWHRAQLRIPIVGDLLRKQAIVRLSVVLSTLLRSGVVFVRALQIGRAATPNLVLKDALRKCEEAVGAGRDISGALEETGAFPPVVVQVVSVGQHSGRLEEMLDRLAADYDRQVATAAGRLTALLEPALILVLVVIVGFVVLATILPMLEAANAF
jgi:type II secretory pathway component PulF